MELNPNRPLRVAALAARANVSASHYHLIFKGMTGYPPMDYFTKWRMCQACRLLDSTSALVKEVAAAVGYKDPLYFSRVFKLAAAMAPVLYRGLSPSLRREIMEKLAPTVQKKNGDTQRQTSPRHSSSGRSHQASRTQPNENNPNN
jgi:AraC-like DNA-binding protein